jgi:hypothetical protein
VVGCDRISELEQHACSSDVADRGRLGRHAVEVGRLTDIGGVRIPVEDLPLRCRQRLPLLITREDIAYESVNISAPMAEATISSISDSVGQRSASLTSLPCSSVPRESFIRSMSMVPASAYATTSGGEAR